MRIQAHFALYALLLTSAPVLLWQGRRVRRDTPRLPPAGGPLTGTVEPDRARAGSRSGAGGDAAPSAIRIATIGESTVAGVGAAHHGEAMTGHLARLLAERLHRTVKWSVYGLSGATVSKAHQSLVPAFDNKAARDAAGASADLLVIAFGVNDVIEHTIPHAYATALKALVGAARSHFGADVPVLLAAVPPMHKFPALPQPLRAYLGLRATLLERAAVQLRLPRTRYVKSAVRVEPEMFATDGFHPSPNGYAVWAQSLAHAAIRFLAPRPTMPSSSQSSSPSLNQESS